MRKILFISPQPFFQWRGSPIRVGFNVQALAELGYSVDLLTLPIGEDREVKGVRVFRVPNLFHRKSMPIGPSFWKVAFGVLVFFKALGMALRHKYDVIHAIEDGGPMAAVIARLTGSRFIFEKHSDPAAYKKGFFRNLVMSIYSKVERFSVRRADAVIATGPGLAEQARRMAPKGPVYHLFDIPSSLLEAEPESVERTRKELRQNINEVLITFVGSFAVYQGVELMFSAMPAVIRKHKTARFIIIGGTPAEIEERRQVLRQEGVESSVSFIGKIPPDDLPSYLAASDILLSPRRAGANTPLKLLDYMKAGRAIVASDNSANRQILDDSRAVLVQPEPDAFAKGISSLVVDAERRKKLGEEGRKLIDNKYNYPEFKKLMKKCYEEAVKDR